MGIFKSYDVRGVWGRDWDAATAREIGRALPGLLAAQRILVGRDARLSTEELFAALAGGMQDGGAEVVDIGRCDTPAVYFATARYGMDGSVMITASHNPPEYNGLKISRAGAVPVGYDTGLAELERRVAAGPAAVGTGAPGPARGALTTLDVRADYVAHHARFRSDLSRLSAVIDCSNGMAGAFLRDVLDGTGLRFETMFEEPDGRFPHHAPNPLEVENLAALQERVRDTGASLGICFDGDADRVMFVDEAGRFVSPDLVICLLGAYYFRRHPGRLAGGSAAVSYDVRSSRSVVEALAGMGAEPVMCRVGHSFAKKLLRDTRGIVGGELAGHYYFRENYYCDSAFMAALAVLEVLAADGRPLSAMIAQLTRRWHFSGEINFTVPNGPAILERVRADFAAGRVTDLDGIRVDFDDWWFNLRVSNTEPLLRLVVEAATAEGLRRKTDDLSARIRRLASA